MFEISMKTYTDYERRHIASAFKNAKEFLWDGLGTCQPLASERYICAALTRAQTVSQIRLFGCVNARNIIAERMNSRARTLELWLSIRANVPTEQLSDENMQAYRHRWLDALIAEFSQGD